MRIMQFCIFFPWGLAFQAWALFGCLLGSPRSPSWSQVGPIWISVGPLGGFLGVLGGLLGALGSLVGPIWASVGWLCAFLEALWRKSGHQLGDSVSLGVRFGFFWVSGLRIKFFALSLDATGWVCGYWWSRFRSMSMRKYWSQATHKTKCTHVRNLPVHVYMLIHYMTCALAATNYWKLLDSNRIWQWPVQQDMTAIHTLDCIDPFDWWCILAKIPKHHQPSLNVSKHLTARCLYMHHIDTNSAMNNCKSKW